jgi:hypothetical protein
MFYACQKTAIACVQPAPQSFAAVLLITLLLAACGGQQPPATGGASGVDPNVMVSATADPPKVSATLPLDVATGIPLNSKVAAIFDRPMRPLSNLSFTVKAGTDTVGGSVQTSADGMAATFTPAAALSPDVSCTASVSRTATATDGLAMAADNNWTFTTGTQADTTAPSVTATQPTDSSTGVATNTALTVTFSEAIDPLSLTAAGAFVVQQGNVSVPGHLYFGPGYTATFVPSEALDANKRYTATMGATLTDLQGNPLQSPLAWAFTTAAMAAKGPARVILGAAGGFAVLAKAAISTVPASAITGDIGVSPAAATYMTGFSLVADASNTYSTSMQIVGKAYAANYAVPTPAQLTTAVSNMETAYTDAAGRKNPDVLELGSGNIGGKTLSPGLYKWTSTVTIPTQLTLAGGANDVWIMQTTGDLTMSANLRVNLTGGALPSNVFWQVAGATTIGTGAHFEGVLLCKTQVTLQTGATLSGRIFAQTQVALQKATVTQPTP